jgi:hypothetical protein
VGGAALDSGGLVDVGSASHIVVGHDRRRHCFGLCSLGQRVLNQPLYWRARQLRELLWHLIAWSAWARTVTDLAGTTAEGGALVSVRLVEVGTACNFVGGNDRRRRCSGLCSIGRRGHSQPL